MPETYRELPSSYFSLRDAHSAWAPGRLSSSPDLPPPSIAANRDFDFMLGEWLVDNRRLLEPLTGSSEWTRFHTVHECRPLLDGLGQVEECVGDGCEQIATLRLFERAARTWAIYKVSSLTGVVEGPLRGEFNDGVGVFVGRHGSPGRPLVVRHTWTARDPSRPCFEQAFSADGGTTWETNWVKEFARAAWPR